MNQVNLPDLAQHLMRQLAPLITSGNTDLPAAAQHILRQVLTTLARWFENDEDARLTFQLYRNKPGDIQRQQILAEQIVNYCMQNTHALHELITLVAQMQALPGQPGYTANRIHTQMISDQAQVGVAVAGDVHGSLIVGGEKQVANANVPPGAVSADATPAKRQHLVTVHHMLTTTFDEGELRTLCFELGLAYEDLPGEGKSNKARELVTYLARRQRLSELIIQCRRLRPHAAWPPVNAVAD